MAKRDEFEMVSDCLRDPHHTQLSIITDLISSVLIWAISTRLNNHHSAWPFQSIRPILMTQAELQEKQNAEKRDMKGNVAGPSPTLPHGL